MAETLGFFFGISLVFAFIILLLSKLRTRKELRTIQKIREAFKKYIKEGITPDPFQFPIEIFLREVVRINEEIQLDAAYFDYLYNRLGKKWMTRLQKTLKNTKPYKRIEAAIFLSLFTREENIVAIGNQLQHEKIPYVQLQLAYSLVQLKATSYIPTIIALMKNKEEWLSYRIAEILLGFGQSLEGYLLEQCRTKPLLSKEEIILLCVFLRRFPQPELLEHLVLLLNSSFSASLIVGEVLLQHYPYILCDNMYLQHPNHVIRSLAYEALGTRDNLKTLFHLIKVSGDPYITDGVTRGLQKLISKNKKHLELLYTTFNRFYRKSESLKNKNSLHRTFTTLGKVLLPELEYFLYGGYDLEGLLYYACESEQLSVLSSFLDTNKNPKYEEQILHTIKEILKKNPDFLQIIQKHCTNTELLKKLGLEKLPEQSREPPLKLSKRARLVLFILGIALLTVPFISWASLFFTHSFEIQKASQLFIENFTRAMTGYFLILNSIYLFLVLLSGMNIQRQYKNWQSIRSSFLSLENMLPSVSILAPAFKEELTIVDSVRSLLSLNYPKFEVIVICDGSPDRTLQKLITAFNLERIEREAITAIPTRPIRGFYGSKQYPYLLVIDKLNGGKADSLNAGINYAKNDYLCCIDADSLLEKDALLRMMHHIISAEKEVLACGGNILPVNGCKVQSGAIKEIHIPNKLLSRFQTIEYLRAFLTGRLGWAMLDALVIISGAFGVFSRKRVLEINGYLTGSASGKMDTVGEDMELVVRLRRHARENKIPATVSYCYNANCWTEVPEDWGSFSRQRDRWHRGLLEILTFHWKCLGRPRYGAMGLLALPYFWIFECIGPFFELFSLVTVLIGLVTGFLSFKAFSIFFSASVLLGTTISVISLVFTEARIATIPLRETLLLLLFTLFENFGYRQLVAIKRVPAYFKLLIGKSGWGAIKRRGFTPTSKV
ncbi:MAG: glycosyltransferase family 2 protein [Treponemataceae bacterium]|nr:glycosyltransferase family 2 protein [Treponemataceae bacterium]